jgi:hypothetical protein
MPVAPECLTIGYKYCEALLCELSACVTGMALQ